MSSPTIFEKIKEVIKDDGATPDIYRNLVKKISSSYKKKLDRVIREEKSDRNDLPDKQDENILRRYPILGHLYFFEYKPKIKHLLPYYDKFPLAYVLRVGEDHFYAANLHYLHPKKRLSVIADLKENRINIPKVCIHKYIDDHVDGLLLDLSKNEWESAINLPVDNFSKVENGREISFSPSAVWAETSSVFYKKEKGDRKVKQYAGDSKRKGFAPTKNSTKRKKK